MNNITLWAIYLTVLFVLLAIGALISTSILGLAITFFVASLVAMLVVIAVSCGCLTADYRTSGSFTSLCVLAFVIFIIAVILFIVAIVQHNKNKKKVAEIMKHKQPHHKDQKKPSATLETKGMSYRRKASVDHHVDGDEETFDEHQEEEFKVKGGKAKVTMKNVQKPRRVASRQHY